MNQLDDIKEDIDVAKPFFERLLLRAREKHPGTEIRIEDISIKVEIRLLNTSSKIHRLLDDIVKEGISF